MAESTSTKNHGDGMTKLSVQGQGWRVSIIGSALAVITLIAVLGVIWIASKALDISARAIPVPDNAPESPIAEPP